MPKSLFGPRDGIFSPNDLGAMRRAYLLALTDEQRIDAASDDDLLGRLIVRLYRLGVVEPDQLASAAGFPASSRLFQATPH